MAKKKKKRRSPVGKKRRTKKPARRRSARSTLKRRAKTRRPKKRSGVRSAFDPKSDNFVFGMAAGAVFLVFAIWWASVKGPGAYVSAVKHFSQAEKYSTSGKIDYWSRQIAEIVQDKGKLRFVGRVPAVQDSAPLVPEKFDCTTYVETVAALARSSNTNSFFKNLKKIRYKNGRPTFENRNHFPSLDWIPNNSSASIIKDVTKDVAKKADADYESEKKTINRKHWLSRKLKKGDVSRSIASVARKTWKDGVTSEVTYIPVSDIDKVYKHIPSGTILNLVRKDLDDKPVLVSHQGFVIRYKGKVFFRHATSKGKIQTTELKGYLQRRLKNEQWPVIGFNLNQIRKG